MSSDNVQYFIPYFISLLISFIIGVITWRRREVAGAKIYSLMAFSQCMVSFGYIMELASPTLGGKIFWDDFQWLGFLAWAVLFPVFSYQFTRSEIAEQKRLWFFVSIVPVVFLALLWTNPLHGLVHHDEWLVLGQPFDALRYDFTPVVWVFGIYGYFTMAIAFGNLLLNYYRTDPIYRAQVGAVVVGGGIPLLGTILVLFGVTLSFQRDIAPLTLAVGNVVVAYGLSRYHLFDIVPVAWNFVIQNMSDYVVVMDSFNRIVGLNESARARFGEEGRSIIGKSANVIFAQWIEELKALEGQEQGQIELDVELDGKPNTIGVHVTTLRERKGHLLGRIFVARNITRQKEIERELRFLNTNLESLVQERTRELAAAYDSTLEGWAKALEIRDKETEGHSRRVTALTVRLAQEVGLAGEEIEHIRRGALLHDIGKMAIPDEILNKPGELNPEEWQIMKRHPTIASDLLSHISYLEKALEVPSFHHERWDGQGYPHGLKGKEIPLAARIFTLVDNWDALLSDRPYRKAWQYSQVTKYFREQSGKIFDPELTAIFFKVVGTNGHYLDHQDQE